MNTIFVDCDDTLVVWHDEVNQDKELWIRGSNYDLNHDLIGLVKCIQSTHPEWTLVIWSGGGVEYAERWARECGFRDFLTVPKDMRTPNGNDFCIDDMELTPRDKRIKVYSPGIKNCPLCVPVKARNDRGTSGRAIDSLLSGR